jgi:hypothetical protein
MALAKQAEVAAASMCVARPSADGSDIAAWNRSLHDFVSMACYSFAPADDIAILRAVDDELATALAAGANRRQLVGSRSESFDRVAAVALRIRDGARSASRACEEDECRFA